MRDTKEEIANLVKLVAKACGYESAAICAVDCLLQWRDGQLDDTMKAWGRYLDETRRGDGHTDTERHGAWVPAIPL